MTAQIRKAEVKTLKDQQVLSYRWKGTYQQTGKAMGKLYRAAGRHAAAPALNLCHDGEYKEFDADVESCLPVKKMLNTKLDCKVLPGGTFATLIHIGPYETIGESYARLFAFIVEQGNTADKPSREIYHKGPGMFLKGNPERYETELQIPLL